MSGWYVDRPVLVLGGLGFVGVNLVRALLDAGALVTIVTPARSRHAETAAECESRGARIVEGDLRDGMVMKRVLRQQAVVFNLSGQSGAQSSMEDPWTDLDVNCRGNLVLLEALREVNHTARMVFVGSRLEYGKPTRMPVAEDDPINPLCLHAVHKLAVEQYLSVYAHVYGVDWSVARLTNPYGPGQPQSRAAYGIVNRLVHLALANTPLTIYGDGAQQRDYIYVEDAAEALLAIASCPAARGRIYNVGSGVGTRLVDMAHQITAETGGGRLVFVPWPPLTAKIETGDFIADISRIAAEVGWRPKVGVAEGLRRTVAFYRQGVAHS